MPGLSKWIPLILLASLCFICSSSHCQAIPTAERKLEIQAYGLGTGVWTHYRRGRNLSFTGGATLAFRAPVAGLSPGLTIRTTVPVFSGQVGGMRTWLVGPEFYHPFKWGKPYGHVLIGKGSMTFLRPRGNLKSDDSVIKVIGGGTDLPISSHFWLRGEVQKQWWSFDPRNNYSPVHASVGLMYVFR